MVCPSNGTELHKVKRTILAVAAVLLALASPAHGAPPAGEPLAIEHDELPNYWVPVETTIMKRLPEPSPLRRGRPRPMSTSVTLTGTIDTRGRVRDVDVIDARPARSDPAWAVTALKAFEYAPAPANADRTPVRWTQTITLHQGPLPGADGTAGSGNDSGAQRGD
jgi:hypothetical protein